MIPRFLLSTKQNLDEDFCTQIRTFWWQYIKSCRTFCEH